MSGLLVEVLQGLAIAIVGGVVVAIYRGWLSAQRSVALQRGRQITFDAGLRANLSPYPQRWRTGWLTTGAGPPAWKPRFGLVRRTVPLPLSATVDQVRQPSGVKERFFFFNVEYRVIVARAGDVNLEIAIPLDDLLVALQALASGPGGGWRIRAEDLEPGDED